MNAIEKHHNFKYEYSNGMVITEPFKKANKENLLLWWEKFKSYDVHNYEYYIVGGFLNKKTTKDVDILVKGEIKEDLYSILTLGKLIGFEYNILIDIFWCNDFFDKNNYKPITKIRNFNWIKITKKSKTHKYPYDGVKISENLFKIDYEQPHSDYIKCNKYKNNYIKIKDFINGTTNRNSIL